MRPALLGHSADRPKIEEDQQNVRPKAPENWSKKSHMDKKDASRRKRGTS